MTNKWATGGNIVGPIPRIADPLRPPDTDDEPWHLYVIEEPRRIPWGLLALVAVVALIAWRKLG